MGEALFNYKRRKCAMCGKTFLIPDAETWAYKIGYKKSAKKFFCRYNCMIEYEKTQPKKRIYTNQKG